MKTLVKKVLRSLGLELKKITPYSNHYPVANMEIFLRELVDRGLQCTHIMDVGANLTKWSLMAKKAFPNAAFCLIEPQVEMQEKLQAFCNATPGSVYFLAGAGAQAQTKYLTVWHDLQGSSFLPPENDRQIADGTQRAIQIIAIDDIIRDGKFGIPQLVKLDIQGYELEALKGAASLFGKTEVFILEVSMFRYNPDMPVFNEVVEFMRERGYIVYDFPGFLKRPLDNALGQCDVCFVKQNGLLQAAQSWE